MKLTYDFGHNLFDSLTEPAWLYLHDYIKCEVVNLKKFEIDRSLNAVSWASKQVLSPSK